MKQNGRQLDRILAVLAAALIAVVVLSLLPTSARAQFTTIINVPPDIGDNQSIGSNTQLNMTSGSIGTNFDAGNSNGSSVNVEVNISGGMVGTWFDVWNGSTVNISGGTVDHFLTTFSGSVVNISGGSIGILQSLSGSLVNISGGSVYGFDAYGGSLIHITGGSVRANFDAESGSTVNILGGAVGNNFKARGGSTVNISGGAFGDDFTSESGSNVRILGNDFSLNGIPIADLGTIGSTFTADVPADAVLSGIMADGSPFAFALNDDDRFATGTLTLEATELPVVAPGVYMASTSPLPLGIRASQTLIVDAGSIVGDNYNAAPGSTIQVQTGGTIGANLEAVGAIVHVTGGAVGNGFDVFSGAVVDISGGTVGSLEAFDGSQVNISGGSVGFGIHAFGGSALNISGGVVGSSFRADSGSVVNISGGTIVGNFGARGGSTVHISGGAIGDDFGTGSGSSIRVSGNDFRLNGIQIQGLGTTGGTVAVDIPADAVFSGVLADGRPFAFFGLDSDSFAAGTLTLEAAELPVASSGVFMASTNPLPLGVRDGQTLIVDGGAMVGGNYNVAPGGILVVHDGGTVGCNLEAVGAEVHITGGSMGNYFAAVKCIKIVGDNAA